MELKDLVGLHKLTAVDKGILPGDEHAGRWGDAYCISFTIDGFTYYVVEEPCDGYRSSMKRIICTNEILKNQFPPAQVMATMRADRTYETNNVLDFADVKSGKVILSVGTGNINDYYPYFVAEWTPENLWINKDVK